jgi:hypothetical protein
MTSLKLAVLALILVVSTTFAADANERKLIGRTCERP